MGSKVCRDQVHYEPQNQCAPPVQCTARVRELLGMIDSPKKLGCDRKCGEFGLSLGISCEKKKDIHVLKQFNYSLRAS